MAVCSDRTLGAALTTRTDGLLVGRG